MPGRTAPEKARAFIFLLIALQSQGVGCNRSNASVEDLRVTSYTGAQLTRASPRATQHTIRLKVVVDASHRREQLRWRDDIEEMIQSSSDELTALFGVHIKVTSIEEWEHDGSNLPLEEVLHALATQHPIHASREDRVLGVTSSLATPTSAQHELGMAYEHGEHFVLRGMQDHLEQALIDASLDRSARHLRESIYHERLVHKRTTVFLHELAHTYGAMHTRDDGQIMSPRYHHKIAAFCPINTILLEEAFRLDAALGEEAHTAWKHAMFQELANLDSEGEPLLKQIPRQEIDRVLARDALRARGGAAHAQQGQPPAPHQATYQAMRRGDHEAAWSALSPSLHDSAPDTAHLACLIQHNLAQQERGDAEELERWCERSLAIAPEDAPEHAAFAAHLLSILALEKGDTLAAFALAQRVEEALKKGDAASAERWLSLALLYAASGALSHAERLLARAGMTRDASSLKDSIADDRQRHSLFDIAPDEEPALYRIAKQLNQALGDEDHEAAARALKRLEALAPARPPTLVARCQVAISKNDAKRIKGACEEAASALPQSAMAHYGLAISHLVHRRDADAIAALKRSIKLAPTLSMHWALLARHYTQHTATGELDALRQAYSDQFHGDPPW